MKNALFSWDFVLQLFRAIKMVEATGLAPLVARPRRSKACFAGICLWQTPRFHRLLLLIPQIFCCAKPLREPSIICPPGCSVCALLSCCQTIRAQTVCSTSGYALVRHGFGMLPQAGIPCSRRAQTPPPSSPVMVRNNTKRS